jgi:hypothetical protein
MVRINQTNFVLIFTGIIVAWMFFTTFLSSVKYNPLLSIIGVLIIVNIGLSTYMTYYIEDAYFFN